MMLRLIDTLIDMRDGRLNVGPLVILSQERLTLAQRSAFELGVDAGAGGLVKPKPTPAPERHLRSV